MKLKSKAIKEKLAEQQSAIVERRKALRHIGVLPRSFREKEKATKTIIERFCKCVDWKADAKTFGYDRFEKFMAASRDSKLFLMKHGDFPFQNPMPSLRRLK